MAYSYDGNGERVRAYNAVTDQTTYFIYDADGELSAEYTVNVPPPTLPWISYLTSDALGSPRVITNSYGDLKARRDFYPFGEEIGAGVGSRNINQRYSATADDTRVKFATYQRDIETGLDFAQSRYFSPKLGRFTGPDEFKGGPDELFDFEEDASNNPTFYADLTNPQSLNKYQYGYNNPNKFNDPDGHCPPTSPCPAQIWLTPRITPFIRPLVRIAEVTEAVSVPKIAPLIRPVVRPLPTVDIIPPFTPIQVFGPSSTQSQPEAQPQARPQPLNARPENIKPDPKAKGPHSVARRNAKGQVTRYHTYRPNPRNPSGFDPKKKVDARPGGRPHVDPKTKRPVPPPHVQEKGRVRPARDYELPKKP